MSAIFGINKYFLGTQVLYIRTERKPLFPETFKSRNKSSIQNYMAKESNRTI